MEKEVLLNTFVLRYICALSSVVSVVSGCSESSVDSCGRVCSAGSMVCGCV